MIGYELIEDGGLCWRRHHGGLVLLSPPHKNKEISINTARALIKEYGVMFVRWESGFDHVKDTAWWHVIKDSDVSLLSLSRNTRSKVRRGLKTYDCCCLSREVILNEGYDVYSSAFARYETHEFLFSRTEFELAVSDLPAQTEFWGVREKMSGKLVAFSENYVEGGVCFYNTIWFDPDSLRKYSSYALFYEMNRYYLEEVAFRYVSDGARNLSHATEIHDFLVTKFGFRKAYARLNVVYTPWLDNIVKITYPFRSLIRGIPLVLFVKAGILLEQEEIRRECAEGKVDG